MKRGDIWWANLPGPWGRRPVLLLARDEAYGLLSWVMVAPLTTRVRRLPSTVVLQPRTDGVEQLCVVSLDAIMVIRSVWIESFVARLNDERMNEVERAIHFALALQA